MVGEAESKMSPSKSTMDTSGNKSSKTSEPSNRSLTASSFVTTRDLPSWMKPKKTMSEDHLPSSANADESKLRYKYLCLCT